MRSVDRTRARRAPPHLSGPCKPVPFPVRFLDDDDDEGGRGTTLAPGQLRCRYAVAEIRARWRLRADRTIRDR